MRRRWPRFGKFAAAHFTHKQAVVETPGAGHPDIARGFFCYRSVVVVQIAGLETIADAVAQAKGESAESNKAVGGCRMGAVGDHLADTVQAGQVVAIQNGGAQGSIARPQAHFRHAVLADCQLKPLSTAGRDEMTPKAQKTVSAVIGAIGLALVAMMITMEGELGALPLGLLLIGVIGYLTGWMRERSSRKP